MVVVAPSQSNNRPRPHLLWKRDTHGERAVASAGTLASGAGGSAESSKTGLQKFEDKIGITDLASKTGLTHWQIFGIFILILLIVVGLVGWCLFRFFRKKRPGDKKAGKGEKGAAGDEAGLVDNEEEDLKEEENTNKPNSEYLGKLQYELKYDFNTQTLIVKVVQVRTFISILLNSVYRLPNKLFNLVDDLITHLPLAFQTNSSLLSSTFCSVEF